MNSENVYATFHAVVSQLIKTEFEIDGNDEDDDEAQVKSYQTEASFHHRSKTNSETD